ncbi:hypothetical protein Tco_0995156 [Tanacetum coccineum]
MVKMLKSLLNAYHLARLQETTNNLMKGMTKASFFHNFCVKDSWEVMDEVDGKKFVKNGFKLIKIDESQVGVRFLEESIMYFDKVCEEVRKSSELESNMSCKVDVDGMANCEEDGEDHEIESIMVSTRNTSLDVTIDEMFDEMSMNRFQKRKYSREVMDEFDGKKFVENRFKLNKIDESQVDVHCLEESIMYFDKEDYEIESSEVVDNNIDLKNLVKVSKEGDKDEEMSSKDLTYRILENQDNKEDDGVKCNEEVRNFVNGVAGMEIDSGRNGDSNSDAMDVDDVVINLSKEDANRDSHKEVKTKKSMECGNEGGNAATWCFDAYRYPECIYNGDDLLN